MPVLGLNHVNIRTPEFKRTVEFLRETLGMTVSPVPNAVSIEKAAWLCDHTGQPILHLASADVPYSPTERLPAVAPRGSGAIQHIALSCSDFNGTRARLAALNISFRESAIPEAGIRQIFVRDPTDIVLELSFSEG
jgi:catechol 2,3-dioxygenase-like lactoylglutathione lyase family enzyme